AFVRAVPSYALSSPAGCDGRRAWPAGRRNRCACSTRRAPALVQATRVGGSLNFEVGEFLLQKIFARLRKRLQVAVCCSPGFIWTNSKPATVVLNVTLGVRPVWRGAAKFYYVKASRTPSPPAV